MLDARSIADGPVCTIHLPVKAGPTFHGIWVAAA
ncbi:MAG: carotenoid oxygenase family protein [Deltaproteobacteria bacterium]|nr:carotenoid oxygenase family protein [Deltaproteobacteria bacterium]MBW2447469.1 carotenoid oxygenase family protein [Deltaproteobacteria bacterium]